MPERQGGARRAAGTRLVAGALLAAACGAAAADCTRAPQLHATSDGTRLSVTLDAPCAPYTPATLALGPLRVSEETDMAGTVALRLPAGTGFGTVSAEIGVHRLQAALPGGDTPRAPVAAVRWPDGDRWGVPGARAAGSGAGASFAQLGFAALGAVADLSVGAPLAWIDAPISAETCGRTLRASVYSAHALWPLEIRMPGCEDPGGTLRIPVAR